MKSKPDETLEEIWAIRRQIAQRFGFDPRKQVAYYQRLQKQLGARIYRPEVPAGVDVQTHAVLHDHVQAEIAASKCAEPTSHRAEHKAKGKRNK